MVRLSHWNEERITRYVRKLSGRNVIAFSVPRLTRVTDYHAIVVSRGDIWGECARFLNEQYKCEESKEVYNRIQDKVLFEQYKPLLLYDNKYITRSILWHEAGHLVCDIYYSEWHDKYGTPFVNDHYDFKVWKEVEAYRWALNRTRRMKFKNVELELIEMLRYDISSDPHDSLYRCSAKKLLDEGMFTE